MSQQQQLPYDVYPYNPVIKSQPDSSHSNGSYGPVFIVLAVIATVSAVACVLGRLCSRRSHRNKEAHHHQHHQVHHQPPPKSNANVQGRDVLGPKEWEAKEKPRIALRERADVEFGFDKRFPPTRVATHAGGMPEPPHFGGGRRPEVRFADNV